TPAHLMLGHSLLHLPPIVVQSEGEDALINYNSLMRKLNAFWRTWSQDYLTSLRDHFNSASRPPIAGERVVLIEPNKKRAEWAIGTIESLNYGTDGFARSAKVRLDSENEQGTVFERPVQRLVPLECSR